MNRVEYPRLIIPKKSGFDLTDTVKAGNYFFL
jgi:hypothetical protein